MKRVFGVPRSILRLVGFYRRMKGVSSTIVVVPLTDIPFKMKASWDREVTEAEDKQGAITYNFQTEVKANLLP